MAEKHTMTFKVDRSMLFNVMRDMVTDNGAALGQRLIATMLGGQGFVSDLGLAVYGIELLPNEGTTPNG